MERLETRTTGLEESMSLLRDHFQGKTDYLIWNIEWPSCSPDIWHLDFCLWDYLKEGLYQDNPQTVIELKQTMDKELKSIGSEVTKAVIDNMKRRANDCVQSGGHHLKTFVIEN